MITTGIRKGELAALHWSDIYFEEQLMYVRKSYATIRNEEKNARRKTVRIQKIQKIYLPNEYYQLMHKLLKC